MIDFDNLILKIYLIIFISAILVSAGYSQESDFLKVSFSSLKENDILGTIKNSDKNKPTFKFQITDAGKEEANVEKFFRLRFSKGELLEPDQDLIFDFSHRMLLLPNGLNTVEVVDIRTDPPTIKGKFIAFLDEKNSDPPEPGESFSETEIEIAAQEKVNEILITDGLINDNGVWIKNNIVHLFIDQTGKLYGNGIPTVATEDQYFQVHLLYAKSDVNKYVYRFSYSGTYTPTFNIYGTPSVEEGTEGTSGGEDRLPVIGRLDYAVIGKFTSQFNIQLIRENTTGERSLTTLLNSTIPIAKKYHVSITTGLVATFLKNPQNIRTSTLPDGNTTLIADDPNSRGMLTLMAIFYPKPRYFIHDNKGFMNKESFGIAVGTRIDRDQIENLFVGLQSDFARGGSVIAGIHYGRQNAVAGYDDFEFGKDIYTGPPIENNIIQQWKANFFIGINLDLRVVRNFLAISSPEL